MKDNKMEQLFSLLGDKLEPKSKFMKSADKNFQDEVLLNTRKAPNTEKNIPNADMKKRKFEDGSGTLKTFREITEKEANNILISDDDNEQSDELEEQEEESDDQPEEPDNQPEEPDDQSDEPDNQPEEPDDQPEEPDEPEESDDEPPVEPKKKQRKGNDGCLQVTGDTIELISQAVADRMERPKRRKG
jgi:hypothetical protein